MADPTPVEISGGTSAQATTTASFAAQAAGRVLVLSVASDDYRTTAGAGRPESTGWTYIDGAQDNLGHYVWYKVAAGSETSVQYTIGSGANSAYSVVSLDQMAAAPLGVSGKTSTGVTSNTPTPQAIASVSPTAGSRWCVVAGVGTTGNSTSGPYSWATYTKRSERYTTSGYRPGTTIGTQTVDGGAAVTGTVGFTATGVEQVMSVVVAFKVSAGGGTSYPLAGSAASTSTTTGQVARTQALAGAAASTTTATGALVRTSTLTGAAVSTSATTGTLANTATLTGSATSVSATTGSLGLSPAADLSLTGSAISTSSTAGTITTRGVLAGTAASTSTAAGDMTASVVVSGSALSLSVTVGALNLVTPDGLTGSAQSTSTTHGSITATGALAGTAASASTTTATLTATLTATGAALSLTLTTGDLRLTQVWSLSGAALSSSITHGAIVNTSNLRNLVLAATVLPDRWTATVLPDRWTATVLPARWTAHVEDQ